jgi:serine phosphatase RsbU (regulator of sigma subunit)
VQATQEREVLLFDAPDTHSRWEGSVAQLLQARQVLDGPLLAREKVVGDVVFYRTRKDGGWTKRDVDFVKQVSSAVSLGLRNAQLYETEHGVAEQLQEALLALPDEVPGVEFAHAYHSASDAARVGGDFYDVFPIGEELVAFTVGDVAGKGLDASALTSLVKNVIRAHAAEKGATPGRILELTNDVVFASTMSESFATVFFGVLDSMTGRLLYSSAGHTTGALAGTEAKVTELPATGPVIGAFPGMIFDEAERQIDLDEVLFLYTDGLTEARRGDELFGEERLFERLAELRDTTPVEMVRFVINEVLSFTGGRLNDDLAVLALRRARKDEPTPHAEKVQV